MLKPRQNPRLPFTLDEIDCQLRRAFFGTFGVRASRDLLFPSLLGTGRIRLAFNHLSRRIPTSIHYQIATTLFWQTPNHVSPPINLEGSS